MCNSKEHGGRRCEGSSYKRSLKNYNAQRRRAEMAGDTVKAAEMSMKIDGLREYRKAIPSARTYTMDLGSNVRTVLEQLYKDGGDPYIVGGSVRDTFLGIASKDIDIEVYGLSVDKVIKSLRKIGHVDEVGKSFGVLKITLGGEDFDISLPRTEQRTGSGHRGFDISVDENISLEEASSRRDFTINSIMYSDRASVVSDPHGGVKDMQDRVLRHVSDAFNDDPLRVLRGVQMVSRFEMRMADETIAKSQTLKDEFKYLSKERIQVEFQKLYSKGKDTSYAFKVLEATEWDKNFPGLSEINDDDLRRELKEADRYIKSEKIPDGDTKVSLLAAVSVHRVDDLRERHNLLSYLTVGDDAKNTAMFLTTTSAPSDLKPSTIKRWVKDLPARISPQLWIQYRSALGDDVKDISSALKMHGVAETPEPDLVNGNDVVQASAGRKPGPWVKQTLDILRSKQYDGVFRTREEGLVALKRVLKDGI